MTDGSIAQEGAGGPDTAAAPAAVDARGLARRASVDLANGNTAQEGAGGPNITAASATVGARSLASSASVDLADEERRSGRQRGLATENVLGVEKREERDCEEEDIESVSRHCLM